MDVQAWKLFAVDDQGDLYSLFGNWRDRIPVCRTPRYVPGEELVVDPYEQHFFAFERFSDAIGFSLESGSLSARMVGLPVTMRDVREPHVHTMRSGRTFRCIRSKQVIVEDSEDLRVNFFRATLEAAAASQKQHFEHSEGVREAFAHRIGLSRIARELARA